MQLGFYDIRMNFGFRKCATIVVNHGRVTDCAGIELPGGTIETLPILSTYKYLGVLEAGKFQHDEVKSKVITTCKQRLWAILKITIQWA